MAGPTTRQELYDRIRSSSKDEVVLEEMVRLGFWPAAGSVPNDPSDEIRRLGEIQRDLSALRTEFSRLNNISALKKELQKRRLEASRQKQAATKARHEAERLERARAWQERKQHEIGFLGVGVSGGLSDFSGDPARLRSQGLPSFDTVEALAAALQISVGQLRFLAFDRPASTVSHYVRFQIPKKSGGTRQISAPMPRLKAVQRWILDHVLEGIPLHDAAHGFRRERSIVTNAQPHVGTAVVLNLDLQDFFPSIGYRRVKGLFRSLGYSEGIATVLALLCTEPDTEAVELDGTTYHVAKGTRHLPQGAPTSPALTNLLCRRLDRRLHGAAHALGFTYTRYADDLTFSSGGPGPHATGKMLRRVTWLVDAEGFVLHPSKTRVLRRGRQQEVTGVVVNDRTSVDRATLRKFRALLFQIEKDGPAGKSWGSSADVFASALGFAHYVTMVDPGKGEPLVAQVRALSAKYNASPTAQPRASASASSVVAAPKASGSPSKAPPVPVKAPLAEPAPTEPPPAAPPKKKWWKLF